MTASARFEELVDNADHGTDDRSVISQNLYFVAGLHRARCIAQKPAPDAWW